MKNSPTSPNRDVGVSLRPKKKKKFGFFRGPGRFPWMRAKTRKPKKRQKNRSRGGTGKSEGTEPYPTDPVMSRAISLFSSMAYSMGSSFANGSKKPIRMRLSAVSWRMPRLIM